MLRYCWRKVSRPALWHPYLCMCMYMYTAPSSPVSLSGLSFPLVASIPLPAAVWSLFRLRNQHLPRRLARWPTQSMNPAFLLPDTRSAAFALPLADRQLPAASRQPSTVILGSTANKTFPPPNTKSSPASLFRLHHQLDMPLPIQFIPARLRFFAILIPPPSPTWLLTTIFWRSTLHRPGLGTAAEQGNMAANHC